MTMYEDLRSQPGLQAKISPEIPVTVKGRDTASGLRLPSEPPQGADALGVVTHYLRHWVNEYGRARTVVKHRASRVVVVSASANAAVGVVGVIIAFTDLAWLGVISTSLAGLIGVLHAWDGLFRHRELWIQRSVVLAQLTAIQRNLYVLSARGDDPDKLAIEGMRSLNAVLAEDITSWSEMRSRPTDRTTEKDDETAER